MLGDMCLDGMMTNNYYDFSYNNQSEYHSFVINNTHLEYQEMLSPHYFKCALSTWMVTPVLFYLFMTIGGLIEGCFLIEDCNPLGVLDFFSKMFLNKELKYF